MLIEQDEYIPYELQNSTHDLALLNKFYQNIYVPEFPDINERESVANMESCLNLKDNNLYGRNNYHILLYLIDGEPVAGSVTDYLAIPNTGVIEFMVVKSTLRGQGLGAALLHWTELVLQQDSRHGGHDGCTCIVAEMNDPFKLYRQNDSLNPFLRSVIWHRWGYQKLRFPYIQPALSSKQKPVRNLLMICKSGCPEYSEAIPSHLVEIIIFEYARWAMRIEYPDENTECQEMSNYLKGRQEIRLMPLAEYVGDASALNLNYVELTGEHHELLGAVIDIYTKEFSKALLGVFPEDFITFLQPDATVVKPYDYHLVAFGVDKVTNPQGMASFFTLPASGFGGYIVFDPAIRGKGYLADAITLIERRMVMDDRGACGWYCECDPASAVTEILRRRGFFEVGITYYQPPLVNKLKYTIEEAPVLKLMYKEFGENFTPPKLAATDLLVAVEWIFNVIYAMDNPRQSVFYQEIEKQVTKITSITLR